MTRDMLKRAHVPVLRTAVVSGSLLVRGIVNALNLSNAKIKTFRPDAIGDALAHIGAALHADLLLAELELMRTRAH